MKLVSPFQLIDLVGTEALLDALPTAVTLIDAKAKRIVYRNAESRRIADASGMPYDGVETAARMGITKPDGTQIELGDFPGVAAIERGVTSRDVLIRMPKLNGGSFVLSMDAAPLRDDTKRIVGAMLTFRQVDSPSAEFVTHEGLDADGRRSRFLEILRQAVLNVDDPAMIAEITSRVTGSYLRVNRCCYGAVDVDTDFVRIFPGYEHGVPSNAGNYRLSQFGENFVSHQIAGHVDVITDTSTDPRTQDVYAMTFEPMGTRAFIGVPLVKGGRMVAFFTVDQSEPREWERHEVDLVEEIAERIWASIERIKDRRALAASESRFQALVEGLPQLTWTAKPNGWVDYVSPQWQAYTGRTTENIGFGWLELLHPEDRSQILERWDGATDRTRSFEARIRLRRHDGEFRYFDVKARPIDDGEGNVLRWIGTNTDIHDLLSAQAALTEDAERQRRVAEAAYRITHAHSIEDILRVATEAARETLYARAVLVRLHREGGSPAHWSGSLHDGRFVSATIPSLPRIDELVAGIGQGYQAFEIDLTHDVLIEKLAMLGIHDMLPASMTSGLAAPLVGLDSVRLGAMLVSPFEGKGVPEDGAVLVQFAQLLTAAIENAELTAGLEARKQELQRATRETFDRLARAASLRDEDTAEHTARVGRLARQIALRLGFAMPEAETIGRAAELHDLGKIGVPDAILRKPGPLTPEERRIMEMHAGLGAALLEGCEDPVLQCATSIAYCHHERWDGRGYPRKLKGADIPIEGRIVAVADAFDAMSQNRPYRQAMPMNHVRAIFAEGRGAQWDPQATDALLDIIDTWATGA